MNATHEALVRSDRRGRLRYAPEQKAAILDAYAASSLSGPKFAALHGVKYQTFAAWLQKRRRAGAAPTALPAPAGCEIHVGDRASVSLAAILIRELSRPC